MKNLLETFKNIFFLYKIKRAIAHVVIISLMAFLILAIITLLITPPNLFLLMVLIILISTAIVSGIIGVILDRFIHPYYITNDWYY